MTEHTAIQIKDVSKNFKLPHDKNDSLKTGFTRLLNQNKSYSIQHALKNIDFDIQQGEFFGIVGRNGSGKSTLLKMIAGIYQPTRGSIKVQGKLVPFIELGVGFNPKLTGRENVFLNGAMLGMPRKKVEENYEKIVEFAELEAFMDQKLKNYSSGMQVRLAFACATFAEADILIVDEVLAVGDASFQKKCFEHFRKLKEQKKTVVFVSHNMDSVREFCTRAALIDKSELVEIGDPDSIAQHYSRLFIGNNETDHLRRHVKKWGVGDVVFEHVSTDKSVYERTDKTIVIDYTLKATEQITKTIRVGVIIKNSAGQNITGINTEILGLKIPVIKKDETQLMRWEIDNIFKEGHYTVTLAVETTSGDTYEWWNGAVEFTVESEYTIPYIVQPNMRATLL